LAQRLRMLRNGGQSDRYHHELIGVNSRLDEIQAAILRARLPHLAEWTTARRQRAGRYRAQLTGRVHPVAQRDAGHVYHLFPVRVADGRDALQAHLRAQGIETLIHYPVALNLQPAFAAYQPSDCPVAAAATQQLLSLPLYPRLEPAQVDEVVAGVAAWRG
jgi:dTDP-4-amino-4,6-dideoxygalactose transaminase